MRAAREGGRALAGASPCSDRRFAERDTVGPV